MRWRIVLLVMIFAALAHFNRISISVAGAERIIRPEADESTIPEGTGTAPRRLLSKTEMGFVYSTFLLSYTVFMIPGGWFIDRFGPYKGWLVVGFGSAVGATLTGLAGLTFSSAFAVFASLLVVRALMGSCNAPLHPSGARLAANWMPPHSVALLNGLITGAACVGMALTYPLFGWLIDRFDWPGAFVVTGSFTAVAALGWTFAGADRPVDSATKKYNGTKAADFSTFGLPVATKSFLALFSDRSLLCLTLSYATVGYFEYLFFYWAEYYFENQLHLSTERSRFYSSLLTLAMGGGMVAGGWLSCRAMIRFGPRAGLAAVPVGGLLLGAVLTAVGAFAADQRVILGSFAIAMAAVGSTEGAFWTGAVRLGGNRGGTAASILNTGGNGVGLLAPVITPWVSEKYSWEAALGLASVICLIGAALWIWVHPPSTADEGNGVAVPLA